MSRRTPRQMVAKIARVIGDGVVPPLDILDALNDAHRQVNGFYFWPWSIGEVNYTFGAEITGTATASAQTVTIVTPDPFTGDPGPSWRVFIGERDYVVRSYFGQALTVESGTGRIETVSTATPFVLRRCGFLLPADYQPRTEVVVWDTSLRKPIPHVSRLHFERLWMEARGTIGASTRAYADAEPYYDDAAKLWYYQIQFVPPPEEGTQFRVVYTKTPAMLSLLGDAPPYWPDGFDEAIELIATRRLGEQLGYEKAVRAGRRAEGLLHQLRRQIADSNVVHAPTYGLGADPGMSGFPLTDWEFDQ